LGVDHFFAPPKFGGQDPDQPNVIMVLFDALSAEHIGMNGYRRDTMPFLTELSKKAIIYHKHYAGGSFTSPGTATLLTGTYPWTHRVFRFNATVNPELVDHNIFNVFDSHYRVAYSHNPLVNTLFKQFENNIEHFQERQSLFLSRDNFVGRFFQRDYVIANQARREVFEGTDGNPTSIFFDFLYQFLVSVERDGLLQAFEEKFPRGLPSLEDNNYFLLEDSIDWIREVVTQTPQPFLGYFHLWPPHNPYATRFEFVDAFEGTHAFPDKQQHILATEGLTGRQMKVRRQHYDESMLYVDAEFNRLFHSLKDSGMLENTWLVLTADHGEMFERGLSGHFHRLLYEGVTHIPLMIFPPGQTERIDVHTTTSAVDVLPTLAYLSGKEVPAWTEGVVLPPFTQKLVSEPIPVYTIEAKNNPQFLAFQEGTFSMLIWPMKIIFYLGYGELEDPKTGKFEVFNLEEDPDELADIYDPKNLEQQGLIAILMSKLDEQKTFQ
jgi:arylsulfatase A-like enzyme